MPYSKTFLKHKYEQMPKVIETVDGYIQRLSASAYRNVRLVANEVLSRNPHTQNFFHSLLFEETAIIPPLPQTVFRLIKYYVKILLFLGTYLVSHFVYHFRNVGKKRKNFVLEEPLYVVDTFVYLNLLQQEQQYTDRFFNGIYDVLEKRHRQFVVLPRFLGRLTPANVISATTLLDHSLYDFLTEFDLLDISDLLQLTWFLLRYPFDVLLWVGRLSRENQMDTQLIAEIIRTLDYNPSYSLIRYFVGRRLGELSSRLYLISWCENQIVDKSMFRGVRETSPSVFIFGCQSLIAYPPYLCMRIAETDKIFGMVPDVILVNGKAFFDSRSSVPQQLGVSFRNKELFVEIIDWETKTQTVIFFSYFLYLDREMVTIASQSIILREQSIVITLHPHLVNTKLALPKLPSQWTYTQQNRFELLHTAKILITSESSTAVEAAALGTSVIIVASQSTFTCNPMLEGRGEIWELVFDSQELDLALSKLQEYRHAHLERIQQLADFYKTNCFVEPTEENIVKAFNL